MTKAERQIVFDKYNGKCAYCGCNLIKGWHVDHIEPIVRNWIDGGCLFPEKEHAANYNPACASCNILKSSNSIEWFREIIQRFIHSLNSYHNQYKFAKRYGLVEETGKKVIFYFETL